MSKALLSVVVALLPAVGWAAGSVTGAAILVPQLAPGQTYSNVFSIMHSLKVDGYDEYVRRNGGSADYTVLAAAAQLWRVRSAWRYDGQPGGIDEAELRDGGRTACTVKADAHLSCQAYLDGSGLIYNPTLWGAVPPQLRAGQTWKVEVTPAWELGGANGVEQVTVQSVDAAAGSAVLMREGRSTGAFGEGEPQQRQLTRNGQTETLDITPGTAHWKGYTTIVRGVIFSDELLVTRDATLKARDGHTVTATERWIMLLNSAPFPTN
jgi:hypothetical protein